MVKDYVGGYKVNRAVFEVVTSSREERMGLEARKDGLEFGTGEHPLG